MERVVTRAEEVGGGGDAEESSDSCDKVFDDSKRGHPDCVLHTA